VNDKRSTTSNGLPGGRPVELRRGYYNTAHHFYRNELN